MVAVFGICSTSPSSFISGLCSNGVISNPSKLSVLPVGSNLAKVPRCKHIVIITFEDFKRNLRTILSSAYKSVQIYVFASPLKLKTIVGAIPLDFIYDKTVNLGIGYKVVDLDFTKIQQTHSKISLKSINYIGRMIKRVKQGSLLTPLMTYIYTLPSDLQHKVKLATFEYITSGKTFAQCCKSNDIVLSTRQIARINSIITSPEAKAFREFFSGKDVVCPQYEINYIKHVLNSST